MNIRVRSGESTQRHSPVSTKQKKAKMSKQKMKTSQVVFFDNKGVVHNEFLSPEHCQCCYKVDILERLRKKVFRQLSPIASIWVLHHDKAFNHYAQRVREFLATHNLATLLLCSPDVTPTSFCLRGLRTPSKVTVMMALRHTNRRNVHSEQGSRRVLPGRSQRLGISMEKNLDAGGEYFENMCKLYFEYILTYNTIITCELPLVHLSQR